MLALIAIAQVGLLAPATEIRRIPAEEARQGVAADQSHVYAISNDEIGKYDRRSGRRVAHWKGDSALFKHMNSCTLLQRRLVCAASNYPDTPMASSVEWFDTRTMKHIATRSLGPGRGSLTWLDWRDGSWWACFANYDGKGGEQGRGHRHTTLVKFDAQFREVGAWLFPPAVLERLKPYSSSGGAWSGDVLLATGHDRKEVYVLGLPQAGSTLVHRGTFTISTPGQAIFWDRKARTLWSLDRGARSLVESIIPFLK